MPRGLDAETLAAAIAEEVGRAQRKDERGVRYAPDQYTVLLSQVGLQVLRPRLSEVSRALSELLKGALQDAGYRLARDPHVTIASDPRMASPDFRLLAWFSTDPLQYARSREAPVARVDQDTEGPPPGAFLVVEGQRVFRLTKPLVTIGRLPDNDLVLVDRHVSRRHAQLRLRDGRYVISDLGSTAGTWVNGRAVVEHVLKPGDVISLATVELVYGEDPGGAPPAPPYPERPGGAGADMETPLHLRRSDLEDLLDEPDQETGRPTDPPW